MAAYRVTVGNGQQKRDGPASAPVFVSLSTPPGDGGSSRRHLIIYNFPLLQLAIALLAVVSTLGRGAIAFSETSEAQGN